MEFQELIKHRYSVRAYKPDPVEDEKIMLVLEAARLAPTAGNRQPFQIVVIHTKGREGDLRAVYPREWFTQAPLVLCVVGTPSTAWVRRDGRQYLGVDSGIVMDHIILAATDLGLGTCFIAAFDEAKAREVLALPDEVEPVLLTPLGYPDDMPGIKQRKALEELIHFERW
ncbi:MAG: nitroreductase [Anaerolineales bacterium]|nr:MAG: nitroreductase [Anaerolineales bacterium]